MGAINFDKYSGGTAAQPYTQEPPTAWSVWNTADGEAIRGTTKADHSAAILGVNNGAAYAIYGLGKGGGEGIRGETLGNDEAKAGVVGYSGGTGGNAPAMYGIAFKDGIGVIGESKGNGYGVCAYSKKTAIYGKAPTAGYFEGNVSVTGDISLLNADCAEDFDAPGDDQAGTVMILNDDGSIEPSRHAYDKKVAGVISGGGGNKPGIVLDRHSSQTHRKPIALMGKVYCKVDATYSSIEVGDLLTTSNTRGHAMKALDPSKAFGAVIGKALRQLKAGTGLVPVLVALH